MAIYKRAFQKLLESLTCPVCKELFRYPITLDCGHSLCRACAYRIRDKEVLMSNCCCPECGAGVGIDKHLLNLTLGYAAVTANVLKEVITWGDSVSTGRSSAVDSGIGEETPSVCSFTTTSVAADNPNLSPYSARAWTLDSQPFSSKEDIISEGGDTQSERSVATSCSMGSMDPPPYMTSSGPLKSKSSRTRKEKLGLTNPSPKENLI